MDESEKVTIVGVDRADRDVVIVELSDGTTVAITLDEVIELRKRRAVN